jgi:hypothetical protein
MVAIRHVSEDLWTTGRRSIHVIANVIKPGRNTEAASPNVFAGLVEATRRADSTTQVLAGVLQELRTQFACDWAMIFERVSAPSLLCLPGSGPSGPGLQDHSSQRLSAGTAQVPDPAYLWRG